MKIEEIQTRLEELESSVAFQDDLHTQLDEIVARQDREILELKLQVKELARRLQAFNDSLGSETESRLEETPPHY